MASTTTAIQATTTTEASTTTTATTSSTSTTTSVAPTTSQATTTTAPPDGDAPPPLNPVPADEDDLDEYARIYREHLAYQNWLGLHPTTDPEILGRVFHRDGPWWEWQRDGMQGLIDDGQIRDDRLEATTITPFPESDPSGQGVILLTTVYEQGPTYFIDASTEEVVRETPGGDSFFLIVELRKSDAGEWLVWDQREPD